MTNDLTDNDRQRIEQEGRKIASYVLGFPPDEILPDDSVLFGATKGAEYATIYEREQQAEVIKKIENELKELRSNAGFKGLDYHTVKFLESLLNTLKT